MEMYISYSYLTNFLLNNGIDNSNTDTANNAKVIQRNNRKFYDEFERSLRKINLISLSLGLGKLREKYNICNFKAFVDSVIDSMIVIQDFSSISYDLVQVKEKYLNAIKSLINISDSFKCLYAKIEQTEEISNKLLLGDEKEENFKIRLLNENNSIDSLIDSVNLIKNIYGNTNKLIGEDESLRYRRVESGSLFLILAGSALVFKTVKPMLEFGYKIYTEQFSPEVKAERKLKEIKVRKEYLSLIFEVTGIKSISELKEPDIDKLNIVLLDLENDIKKLYTLSPCINVDNVKLGSASLASTSIPIEFLESAGTENEDLE
jgi:hypothetical protein